MEKFSQECLFFATRIASEDMHECYMVQIYCNSPPIPDFHVITTWTASQCTNVARILLTSQSHSRAAAFQPPLIYSFVSLVQLESSPDQVTLYTSYSKWHRHLISGTSNPHDLSKLKRLLKVECLTNWGQLRQLLCALQRVHMAASQVQDLRRDPYCFFERTYQQVGK